VPERVKMLLLVFLQMHLLVVCGVCAAYLFGYLKWHLMIINLTPLIGTQSVCLFYCYKRTNADLEGAALKKKRSRYTSSATRPISR
jgi:hypothetical protein